MVLLGWHFPPPSQRLDVGTQAKVSWRKWRHAEGWPLPEVCSGAQGRNLPEMRKRHQSLSSLGRDLGGTAEGL